MHNDVLEVLLTEEQIQQKTAELGRLISEDYKDKNPLIICVLKGAVMFMGDLLKKIEVPLEIDFMAVSSYGTSTESSGVVRIVKDLDTEVAGRHVIIVEDIIDSGLTLSYLCDMLHRRNCASLKIVALLDKPHRRKAEINIDYKGFEIPDAFIVGYGLDYAEKYRNVPYIFIPKPEVYSKA
ncbi:hypoxanthine phosphoribosyltransferase [Desulfuribacillus alkaliarsenatis]|uniref:Hypoxanthine phosphoribosyltransferase n=1 Tax=Desulfuribacillus alkaliarsenatis TaxID=766136 RepID=A0A1E5FYW8_9FIRM|nr:hypoxanthine phosphoribosyltransferase [Desulfuribacillus alkaliarsenatis]OEF95775.1 hypoxanthine phosphoribosyltransferase [Desulfuribacillus alkaliarsenatis]